MLSYRAISIFVYFVYVYKYGKAHGMEVKGHLQELLLSTVWVPGIVPQPQQQIVRPAELSHQGLLYTRHLVCHQVRF